MVLTVPASPTLDSCWEHLPLEGNILSRFYMNLLGNVRVLTEACWSRESDHLIPCRLREVYLENSLWGGKFSYYKQRNKSQNMKGENFEGWKWKLIVCCLIYTTKLQMNFMGPSTVEMIRMGVTLHEVPEYDQKPGCSKGPCWRIHYKNSIRRSQGTCINLYCWILCGKDESCPIGYLATSSGLTVVTFQPPDKRAVFGKLTLQNLCEKEGSSLRLSPLWNSLAALVQGVRLECRMFGFPLTEWQASPNNWGAVYMDFPLHPSQTGTHCSTYKAPAPLWGTMGWGREPRIKNNK